MEKPKFDYLVRPNGEIPFEDFLKSLPKKDMIKFLGIIQDTEDFGLSVAIRMKWVKKLDDNLFELRSKRSSNIQRAIYFHYYDDRFIITHGFTKKTQNTSRKEINQAIRLRKEFQEGVDDIEN
ncbi:MAG: type II toxin-antitoxin system RelE/ParE family toxin [Streptococcaceae bacterium]|jgi:phage-related protein|nr:type II toxin-antitoxin system RelE/ParE family toxin [Streptococcaceae bacterium]